MCYNVHNDFGSTVLGIALVLSQYMKIYFLLHGIAGK